MSERQITEGRYASPWKRLICFHFSFGIKSILSIPWILDKRKLSTSRFKYNEFSGKKKVHPHQIVQCKIFYNGSNTNYKLLLLVSSSLSLVSVLLRGGSLSFYSSFCEKFPNSHVCYRVILNKESLFWDWEYLHAICHLYIGIDVWNGTIKEIDSNGIKNQSMRNQKSQVLIARNIFFSHFLAFRESTRAQKHTRMRAECDLIHKVSNPIRQVSNK